MAPTARIHTSSPRRVLFVQKINSAESAIHAWYLRLTSAVIDSRLQRLFLETDFSWGVAPG
ncbi:MAG: hypothetical protein DME60_13725 [Verrucomicrobia bacterium]|nr:MAG: hypothetical protein DME60_13725 [Verrucomicrobiota bacterium]